MKTETLIDIFTDCKDLKSVKYKFISLVKIYHPDLASSDLEQSHLELMQRINASYDFIKDRGLQAYHDNFESNATLDLQDFSLEFNSENFIKVIKFCLESQLKVELCGSWLWIGGDTKSHKEQLKELSCKFAPAKKLWYYTESAKRGRGNYSMDKIRAVHGSKNITMKDNLRIK